MNVKLEHLHSASVSFRSQIVIILLSSVTSRSGDLDSLIDYLRGT